MRIEFESANSHYPIHFSNTSLLMRIRYSIRIKTVMWTHAIAKANYPSRSFDGILLELKNDY